MDEVISVRGARTHNLKDVSLDLPRGRLIVIAGPSGSGKSSLAFDTLYAEGERRYVESLSPRARQFLEQLPRADVDSIEGLPPAIALAQAEGGLTRRSTVGTLTEIDDHLRVLIARAAEAYCPVHGLPLTAESVAVMTDRLMTEAADKRILIAAPWGRAKVLGAGEARSRIGRMLADGFRRFLVDGEAELFDEPPAEDFLNDGRPHDLDVVVDRLRVRLDSRERVSQSLEAALELGGGRAAAVDMDSEWKTHFSSKNACPLCDFTAGELEPGLFSSSGRGACPCCRGLGFVEAIRAEKLIADENRSLAEGAVKGWAPEEHERWSRLLEALDALHASDSTRWKDLGKRVRSALLWGSEELCALKPPFRGMAIETTQYFQSAFAAERKKLSDLLIEVPCPECGAERLCAAARNVFLAGGPGKGKSFPELERMPVHEVLAWLKGMELSGVRKAVAERAARGAIEKLECLDELGLSYLTLERSGQTLSGGEFERIRLAAQLGSNLSGVLYVLDEPTNGLHPQDTAKLVGVLKRLKSHGNTVLVVEHDRLVMEAADWIVDMGPGAGEYGGQVVACGELEELKASSDSPTGHWLSGRNLRPKRRRRFSVAEADKLVLKGASGRNLKNIDLEIPLGALTVLTGVSGSGKSTLAADTLLPALKARLQKVPSRGLPFKSLEGGEGFDRAVSVDQSPIGRSSRSNAATFTGMFGYVRELFAETLTAKERGYGAARFGFNAKGGRCEACAGEGVVKIPMQFLPDLYAVCDVCGGKRYNRETLECLWQGLSIADVLDLTVDEALKFFAAHEQIARRLNALSSVGLGYIRLGQSTADYSGGEAQRLKLAAELSGADSGRTFYLLDEPTTGLYFSDVQKLLTALRSLTDRGSTVLVIEHDMALAAAADWVIDMGPQAGAEGGEIVAQGTPAQVARSAKSPTGRWLAREL